MTSAVDIIAPKPAARPEPSSKASSRDEDRASFADALDAETAEPEAAPAKEASSKESVTKETTARDEPATPDANAAAQPVQPQPTPAVNSPEAILAGLTQAVPTDAPTAEAGAATPAINAAAAGAAQSAGKAATPQPAAPQADAATPAPTEGAGQAVATNAAAKPAAPAPQAAPTAAATPPATDEAAPLSAPGEERTSATEIASTNNKTTATTTSNTVDPTANKAQGTQNTPAQAAAAATEIKVDVKADTQMPATTPIDTLAGRASNPDIARVAPAHTAMQNAPATTVQVYQRMVERFDGRAQRYEIRLDPAELGRVDVRIEVGADKKVHAVLAAHDSAALTDLMRGQRSLERALSDAGIDLAKDGIRFELSSDQGRNPASDSNGNGRSSNVWRGFNTVDVAVDAQTAAAARPWRSSARLDVVA